MKKGRLKDIADMVGVSITTVSYVLNNANVTISPQTREKVLRAAEELNYTTNWSAKGVKTNHYNAVGIIVEDIRSFFISELIDGICSYAEERGIRVLMCNLLANDKTKSIDFNDLAALGDQLTHRVYSALGKQLDSLIYVGAFYRDTAGIFRSDGHHVSYAYAYNSERDSLSVSYDDVQGSYIATRYLLDCGHRRIAHVNCLPDTEVGCHRSQGFWQAVREAGMEEQAIERPGSMDAETSYPILLDLLSSPQRPTALFVNADSICASAYRACHALGLRIPEDVSVIGFDNKEFDDYMTPPLTSISFPLNEMGYMVMKLTCEEPERHENIKLKCSLVERQSVCNRREETE